MCGCACGYVEHFSWPNMEQCFTLTVVEQCFTLKMVAEKTTGQCRSESVAFFATMVVRSDSCIHVIQMLPFIPPYPPSPCQSIRHKLHQEAVNIRINLFCDKLLVLFLRKHIMKYFILFFLNATFKRYPV